jgi:hypothetical protein
LSGSVPASTGPHVPLIPPVFALEQAWHNVLQGPLQQKLSRQLPFRHSFELVHDPPISLSHVPSELHEIVVPEQAPSSVPLDTLLQVPIEPARLQARQSVVHALLQQTPSAQNVLTHSVGIPQAVPLDFLHVPDPSHALFPFSLHAVLMGEFGFDGTPLMLQTSNVHCLPSTGTSLVKTDVFTLPIPSHSRTLQSPAI